jgi:hypothetical protein
LTSSIDESYVDVSQVGAPGRATWPLLPKVLALILTLTVLGWGVITAFALDTFERTLLPELHLKAATVGRSLVSQMGRALDHGVPPDSLLGMQDFLASALMVNPEVSYLVVANESGRVLFARGLGVDEAVQRIVFFKMPEDVEPGSFQTFEMGNFYDTSVPIVVRGDLIGYMHVGVQHDFLRNQLARVIDDFVMLLIAASVMGYYLIQFFLKLRLEVPIASVRKGMFIGAVRDFRYRVQTAAADDAFRVTRTFNMATRRLSEAYQRLREEAEESKAAQIDPAVTAQIDEAMLAFDRRFRAVSAEERTVLTDDVPMRGLLPLFLLSCATALVLLYQTAGQFITVSNAAFMGPAALSLGSLLMPGARSSYRLAFQPGITMAAIGLVGSTFDPGFVGTVGWNVIAGLGFGWAAGATLLGMSRESTWDRGFNPGPALLGAVFFAITVHATTSGAGHIATDWLVVLLGIGAVLLAWSTGWPNPVSIVGMQIGERPKELPGVDAAGLKRLAIATALITFWFAGFSAMLIVMLPLLSATRGLLNQSFALFAFFFLTWAGVAFVHMRRGHLIPLRLLAVVGGLCAALGIAQLGQAASGVEGLPKLASFLIKDLPGGAAWLGFAAFTLGQAIALGPTGMIVLAATGDAQWLPDRFRRWAILLIGAALGFCLGPLVAQLLVEQVSFAAAAWVAAGFAAVGALLVLALSAYHRRSEPIMIDSMWR